jgi:uncharacterized cupin superfamily protein
MREWGPTLGSPVRTAQIRLTGHTGLDAQPADEFCCIIKGTVTLTDDDGNAETFTAGQCYVVLKGLAHAWHNTEPVRKFYVMFEEDPSGED